MNINLTYYFEELYLPTTRHRKMQQREVEGKMTVSIQGASFNQAPLAMKASEYFRDGELGIREYRFYNDNLYTRIRRSDKTREGKGFWSTDDLSAWFNKPCTWGATREQETVIANIQKEAERYLVVGDEIWQIAREPRYVVMTFGFGRNHGGTALLIADHYNTNICPEDYFTALERDRAVTYALAIAEQRGDTEFVQSIKESGQIEVLILDAVKCIPFNRELTEKCS